MDLDLATAAGSGQLVSAAMSWYDRHARDLPWRDPGTNPWAVLVSEVMLQQTPVARVVPVWRDWLDRWPDPAALAATSAAEAIRAWGRLGYPRRALRLHECATVVVARHGGEIPRDLDALLALPGVGAYTARAVAAFAYGQRHPVVDTNVRRLVARAVSGAADALSARQPVLSDGTRPPTAASDLAIVERLLPTEPAAAARASVALMELGALVCTAKSPRCQQCPLSTGCAWLERGAPPPAGPTRQAQRYAGTDRQVRGILLAALREASAPVSHTRLNLLWTDATQRERALAGLILDGLAHEAPPGHYGLGQRRP